VRTVDPAQYPAFTDAFDFDMTMNVFGESDSPGTSRLTTDKYGGQGAWQQQSGRVRDPVVDALVAK